MITPEPHLLPCPATRYSTGGHASCLPATRPGSTVALERFQGAPASTIATLLDRKRQLGDDP